tara:strand:+ start:24 stop:320 length:297 start_codon:yes stop_codon:yes gene_type:complete
MARLSESSEFTIPLKNLLALVAATAISVWAYFGIMERLTFIERELLSHWEEIEENDNWIDKWAPPPAVAESIKRVRAIELKIKELELKLQFLVATRNR